MGRIRNGEYALAAKKYQRMAKVLDLPAPSVRLGVTNLLREVERLNRTLKIPASLKEWGSGALQGEGELRGEIVSAALADATTAANPRPAAAEHVEALLNKVMGDNPGAKRHHLFTKSTRRGAFCVVYRKSKQTGFEQVEDFRQKSIYGNQENRGGFPV